MRPRTFSLSSSSALSPLSFSVLFIRTCNNNNECNDIRVLVVVRILAIVVNMKWILHNMNYSYTSSSKCETKIIFPIVGWHCSEHNSKLTSEWDILRELNCLQYSVVIIMLVLFWFWSKNIINGIVELAISGNWKRLN